MKKHILAFALLGTLFSNISLGQILVSNWQFNTEADTEGWAAREGTTDPLTIAIASTGESVLTSTGILNPAGDVRISFPNAAISLPVEASSWGELTIRFRQIDAVGDPVAFNPADHQTFAMLGSTGGGSTPWPVLFWDTAGGDVTVNQVTESNGWNVFTFDLSAYTTGTIKALERMDPINSTTGNFEIDYVTITAVPEPAAVAAVLGALTLGWLCIRRMRLS